jgi:NADPH2:quinone reductase
MTTLSTTTGENVRTHRGVYSSYSMFVELRKKDTGMTPSPTMRALRFEAPADDTSTTRVAEVPLPHPGPGQVTVDVSYAGINFVDVMVRRGDHARTGPFPVTPGVEVSGTVRALGPEVNGLAIGERVAAFTPHGGLAEVALVSAPLAVPVPGSLDLATAAAAPAALATAVLLIDEAAGIQPGEVIVIHSAAGGVGQAAGLLARLRGAQAVGVVGSPTRVQTARDAGYDTVLVRGPQLAEQIMEATGGQGADAVLDPLGTSLLGTDLEIARPLGRIVLFGNASGGIPEALPPLGTLMAGNVSIAGFSITSLATSSPHRVAAAIRRALDLLVTGALAVDPILADGLDTAASAQQALAEGRIPGKHVVRVS